MVRDYVNILDKQNWDLFGIYTLLVWLSTLILVPGLLYLLAYAGSRLSGQDLKVKTLFLSNTGALLPFSLMLWMAFVIPMLFTNITFVLQSLSDPFGWGWDFFGTANTPWHQLLPRFIPFIQSLLLLTGLYLSLRNNQRNWEGLNLSPRKQLLGSIPFVFFTGATTVALLFFFTN
jgi:hypothetical protein